MTKGRQKGEYTEGAGARKRLLPLECAVQAAVHLMGFLHKGGAQGQITPDQKVGVAYLQRMAVAERREADPTTGRRNKVGLAVRRATIELLADSCRQ